jgi:hypothetical protein
MYLSFMQCHYQDGYMATNGIIVSELEKIWKEATVTLPVYTLMERE